MSATVLLTAALRLSIADLDALATVTRSSPAIGWAFRLSRDAETNHSILFVHPPFADPDVLSVVPTETGGSEVTALNEGNGWAGVIFPTLRAALLAIGPGGANGAAAEPATANV